MAEQAQPLSQFIRTLGYPLAVLMALGAVFGAINTMYASVSARTREIATLRAVGFGALPVALSTLIEAILFGLVGGVLGGVVAVLIFNGDTPSTADGGRHGQGVLSFVLYVDLA